MFGRNNSDRTYSYKMVVSFSSEPSNRVHDLHGTVTLDPGETINEARDQIIAQYAGRNRRLRGADAFVVSFTYR